MLSFFPRITAVEAAEQQQHSLSQIASDIQQRQALAQREQLLHRKPGRPPKPAALAPPPDEVPTAAAKRSPTYNHWLSSPYIHDILAAFQRSGRSARRTVENLQRAHPRLPSETVARYESLSESSIRAWHDRNGHLLEKYSSILGEPVPRGAPRKSVQAASSAWL